METAVENLGYGTFSHYPAGETMIKLDAEALPVTDMTKEAPDYVYIKPPIRFIQGSIRLEFNDQLMSIFLLADAMRRAIGYCPTVYLPYLPYARQDRVMRNTEPFSLQVLGKLVKASDVRSIITLDVHSEAAVLCVPKLTNIPVEYIINKHTDLSNTGKVLVIPDQGAYKRLKALKSQFKSTAIFVKDRSTEDGHLEIVGMIGDVKDQDCLIVDDICDGGMTFVLAAEYLFKAGAKSVELFVTHGFFTKTFAPLAKAGICHIYTTNSVNCGTVGNTTVTYDASIAITVIDVEEIVSNYLAEVDTDD